MRFELEKAIWQNSCKRLSRYIDEGDISVVRTYNFVALLLYRKQNVGCLVSAKSFGIPDTKKQLS